MSQLIPSKTCKFLGFNYNSSQMTIELPEDKKEKIQNQIEKFANKRKCVIREFAALIDVLGSCCATLKYGWVHMKTFER